MVNKDFELFKKEFKYWQDKFGLNGWKTYFVYEPIQSGDFADVTINASGMIATVRLNSELSGKDVPFKDVRQSAKHEAIHLLIGRLEYNGRSRFISPCEMDESSEELVHKLEELING